MRIAGERRIPRPQQEVWEALLDPEILQKAVPGCEKLVPTGDHAYDMEVTLGIAAVKGHYSGTMALMDLEPPNRLRMKGTGGGRPGQVNGEGTVSLAADGDVTVLTYDGDARVAGPIAAVGQRLLGAASKKIIGDFFKGFEKELTS